MASVSSTISGSGSVNEALRRPGEPPRFFTLEHGIDLATRSACTYLCEWTHEGTHRNHGIGPEAEPEAFVGAILQRLTEEPS